MANSILKRNVKRVGTVSRFRAAFERCRFYLFWNLFLHITRKAIAFNKILSLNQEKKKSSIHSTFHLGTAILALIIGQRLKLFSEMQYRKFSYVNFE